MIRATITTERQIRVIVWTGVGQAEILDAISPFTNLSVNVANNVTEFEAGMAEAEIVGALGRAIGMHVVGVSRTGQAQEGAHEIYPISRLLDLLPRAEAIVAALPLNGATAGLFGDHVFGRCRPGTFFVNVGRGATVNHAALLRALATRAIRAAALDVLAQKPLPPGDALWSADRLLLTPHIGGAGDPRAIRLMALGFAANLRRFIRGEPLHDLIFDRQL